jgi:glyoxalase family protein
VTDPDGLLLELVASEKAASIEPWSDGPVPAEHAVRGLHGATIWEDGDRGTADFLTAMLGFQSIGEDGGLTRLESDSSAPGAIVNLRRAGGFWRGSIAVGTVHHMAFRAADDATQLSLRSVIDRQYFHSVYFQEPGGVLFEIATDGPGFAIDEPVGELGTRLKLPSVYEFQRAEIEQVLPPLRLPTAAAGTKR